MIYLLDTDILIYWLNGNNIIERQALSVRLSNISYSIISYAELYFGAYNSKNIQQDLDNIRQVAQTLRQLPFNESAAELLGEIRTFLKRQGLVILDVDIMIASTAIAQGLILVSNNTRHFERIDRLSLENWLE